MTLEAATRRRRFAGDGLERAGRYEEALACYDRALEINPGDARVWDGKAILLFTLGRHEEAMGCWERALSADPEDADAWANKGVALSKLGRHEEAVLKDTWGCKAQCLEALGLSEEAVLYREMAKRYSDRR